MSFDPITLGAAAALAGGTALTGLGRNSANKAHGAALNAEGVRQRGLRDQASGAWDKSVDGMDKPKTEAGLADAQTKRADAAKANVTNFSAMPVEGIGRAPKVITDAHARRASEATAGGLDYADRTGKLEGYGDQIFSRNVDIGRNRQEIDKYGNFSRGSMSVLPMEMEGASNKGSTMRGIGEIFSGLGNLGLLYGFTRGVPKAAPGAASQWGYGANMMGPR